MKKTQLKAQFQKSRRNFIVQSILTGSGILIFPSLKPILENRTMGLILEPARIEGLNAETGPDYLEGASWYRGNSEGNGFYFEFPTGTLADKKYITADMLAGGDNMIKFLIELSEGKHGRKFRFQFGVLN